MWGNKKTTYIDITGINKGWKFFMEAWSNRIEVFILMSHDFSDSGSLQFQSEKTAHAAVAMPTIKTH